MTTSPPGSVPEELRRLAGLAWPVVLGQLGMMLMGIVDTMMVGRLGQEAMAAVALGHTWSWLVAVVGLGAAHGLDPHFSQAFGAGKPAEAGAALVRGLLLMVVISLPMAALHLVAAPGLAMVGQPEELLDTAGVYCWILAPSVPIFLCFQVVRSYLHGAGQMRAVTWAIALANLVNVLVNWVFIFGKLGFPALGAPGAAWATLLSRIFMLLMLLALSRELISRGRPGWAGAVRWERMKATAADAIPVGFQVGLESWAFGVSTLMVGWLGSAAVAAHSVVLNMAAFAFMVPLGISVAGATRVGNLIGAGYPWARSGWAAVAMCASVMSCSAVIFASVPELLLRAYTQDPEVIVAGAALLPLVATFQLFDGTQVACFGVLRGAGDTRMPALANILGYWLFGLPVGAWLAFDMGWRTRGIWAGLTLGLATVAISLVVRLRYITRQGGRRV